MAIRRAGRMPASPIITSSTSRSLKHSHSVLPTSGLASSAIYHPRRAASVAPDTRVDDAYLFDRVSGASYLSNATLDDCDDTVRRSRGRDAQLLRDANNAIPSRGSVRDTASTMASLSPFGPRRYPRRFGRKARSSLPPSTLAGEEFAGSASPAARPRYGSVPPSSRASSESRSMYGDVDAELERRSRRRERAKSVDPFPRPTWDAPVYTPNPSVPRSSRKLSPSPMTHLSESKLLGAGPRSSYGGSGVGGGFVSRARSMSPGFARYARSMSPTLSSAASYAPYVVEYEPEYKPQRRRAPRVVATPRRAPGNYYGRLIRKRGRAPRASSEYRSFDDEDDAYSVLSDVDSLDGTYDHHGYNPYDDLDEDSHNNNTTTIVSVSPSASNSASLVPASSNTYYTHRHPYTPGSYSISPDSPFYVDQDTEYVPFGPSRPLQTKGLFELSSPYDDDDDDGGYSTDSPPTADLSLSTYLPDNLRPSSLRPLSVSRPRPPVTYRSVVPYTSSYPSPSSSSSYSTPNTQSAANNSLDLPSSSSSPSLRMLEDLVSSAAERAKSTLNSLAVPAYHGASMLLSVEGQGLTQDGKRVNFTYTPPPVPLYGSSPRLDSNLLALAAPASYSTSPTPAALKPIDNFLAGYMERMQALRSELDGSLNRDRARRGLSASPSYPSYSSPSYSSSSSALALPSYHKSHDYVPVKHLRSGALEQVPVTSYRRRHDDGRTHRMDVFSLGEMSPRIQGRAISIPASATGGQRLTVLDKINIKAAIIASKMEPDVMKRRPRSDYATRKYRQIKQESRESIYSGSPRSGALHASSPPACGGDPANPPLSDLRRRIRRTLNKSRRNSSVN